jgi:hypothetical protein
MTSLQEAGAAVRDQFATVEPTSFEQLRDRHRRRQRRRVFAVGSTMAVVVAVAVVAVLARSTDGQRVGVVSATGGPTARVEIEPAAPTVGELVTFRVYAEGPGFFEGAKPDYGDGSPDDTHFFGPGAPDCSNEPSGNTTSTARRDSQTMELTHSYARAGSYEFHAAVTFFDPCRPKDEAMMTVDATTTVTVLAAAEPPSNGAVMPSAIIAAYPVPGADNLTVAVDFDGHDEDGYLHSLAVDWGDGSAPERVERPLANCSTGPSGWPDHRPTSVPTRLTHRYATPGSYVATVTATTTGCDGRDAQQATDTWPINLT